MTAIDPSTEAGDIFDRLMAFADCPRCGTQVAKEAKFCPGCGMAIAFVKADQFAPAGFVPTNRMRGGRYPDHQPEWRPDTHENGHSQSLRTHVGPDGKVRTTGEQVFIDWAEFWAKDRREAEWLHDDVLARGRGHSIFAGHKVGKSELTLWLVYQLVRQGHVVIYLDFEMGEDDLYERLEDMGCGPDTDLSLLRYALLPTLPPLDTAEGAAELLAIVDTERDAHPDRHVAVIIDTIGRAVHGEENSADTIRTFYRHTGLGLKQRGVTWARLDHSGKDVTAGQRGSSAKSDDVDVVWQLTRTDNGSTLTRKAARMSWVPEKVVWRRLSEPLRYVRVSEEWPAGTKEAADLLDDLGVPLEAGRRIAEKALRDAGHNRRHAVVGAAQKWRRKVSEEGAG